MSATDSIAALAELVDRAGFLVGADIENREPGLYVDEFLADAVLRPTSTDEVSAILRHCNEHGLAVIPHGGMTGLVRGTQTARGSVVLSLERMNAIERIDPVSRTAHVEAGVTDELIDPDVEAAAAGPYFLHRVEPALPARHRGLWREAVL